MRSSSKIIIFTLETISGENILGFKIASSQETAQIKKALKLLEDNYSKFAFDNTSYQYSLQNFEFVNVSSADLKVLNKFFDINLDDEESNTIGFIPNIIEDAYQENLLNDEEEQQEYNYQEDSDY